MKTIMSTAACAALLLASMPATADISYNFVQAGWQAVDIDDPDVDGDGIGVSGSFEIGEQFHAFAGYSTADFDFGVDLDQITVGLGFNTPIADQTDFVARLGYVEAEIDASGFGSADENGYAASIGLRSMVAPSVELAGSLNYVDFGDGDDTSVSGQALYYFNEQFALGAGAEFGDDVTSYGVAIRFYFGN